MTPQQGVQALCAGLPALLTFPFCGFSVTYSQKNRIYRIRTATTDAVGVPGLLLEKAVTADEVERGLLQPIADEMNAGYNLWNTAQASRAGAFQ